MNKENTIAYKYDGSPTGLLCALADAIKNKQHPTFIAGNPPTLNFAEKQHTVVSDEERSEAFLNWLKKVSSAFSVRILVYIIMSDYVGYEETILKYCIQLQKYGNNATLRQADPIIRNIMDHSNRVTKEIHRFKGLIRFQELKSGKYWAPFEPDNNIIAALVPHFKARFPNQKWILHDIKRQIIATWDNQTLESSKCAEYMRQEELSQSEKHIQQLWKTFFKSITIENRLNQKVQTQFMPKRYWKYLPETKN